MRVFRLSRLYDMLAVHLTNERMGVPKTFISKIDPTFSFPKLNA